MPLVVTKYFANMFGFSHTGSVPVSADNPGTAAFLR
jgi:hypothetical protein